MFRDKDKNLERLEKELLADEGEKEAPVWEQEKWVPEDCREGDPEEAYPDEISEAPQKRKLSKLMKLSITALCLLGGILLVMLYWLIRFF